MAGTRTEAACLQSAIAFDWEAHNAAMDAGMARLKASLEAYNAAEAAISTAAAECARDLQVILGEAFK